ncbi:MAG: 8-oxo-dGTP diphosphatase MutT [Proteobacteria bacterium]|nr:8-oxo-dGTP diphosphatase MutT [Pseudomonadota bacterium]
MNAVHVMAGVLSDAIGRVLIAQRPAGRHLAGGWEFPGGKLHPGEERIAGLARELREELGVKVLQARPLIRLRHRYPDREIRLDVWRVDSFAGEPQGLDGQALRWCDRRDLNAADLLPADRPVITALQLPTFIGRGGQGYRCGSLEDLHSDRKSGPGEGCSHGRLRGVLCEGLDGAARAEEAGADFIAFGVALPRAMASAACEQINLPVFLSGCDPATAWSIGAVGVYRDQGVPDR